MKFGVLVFPGSNCDHDTYNVLGGVMGQPVTYLWHESHDLEGCDAILVPGRLRLWRLPAHRRHRALRAHHAERCGASPTPAAW